LEASYYEGQLFTDIAGLDGISTVKGIQYAYANPNDYTVHTISQSLGNESEIDSLNLSTNTKDNPRTDAQALIKLIYQFFVRIVVLCYIISTYKF